MVAPALAAAIVAGIMFWLVVGGDPAELVERGLHGVLVALALPALQRLDPLALDLGVGGEDAAVGTRGQR